MGILISYSLRKEVFAFSSDEYLSILFASGILCFAFYLFRNRFKTSLAFYFFLLLVFGFVSFQYQFNKQSENNVSGKIPDDPKNKIVLRGVIAENPEVKPESIRFLLDEVKVDNSNADGMVLATVYRNKFKESEFKDISYGSIVEIEGTLEMLPHRRNPGDFDYGEYLKMHGVDAVFYTFGFDKIKVTVKTEQNFYKSKIINPVRDYSINIINTYIGGDEGEFLKGLVLGERSNISKEIKQDFVNAGVAHIIAVSGLNVAYVLIIIWAFLAFIPIRQNYKIFTAVLLLIFYMNLTGNTPSIIRATIMASVFLLARAFERRSNVYNVISFSALVILLIDPRQLFDAGFILSFSAILSIVIIYPKIDGWLNKMKWYSGLNTDKFTGKLPKFIFGLFFGTLAAQIGTLPVTAIMFRKISLVSLAANLFAIPLSNITLAIGFLMVITSLVSSWLASVFASVNIFLMFIQLKAIAFCASLDHAFIETYFFDSLFLIVYYIILILLFTVTLKNYVYRIIITILIIANIILYHSFFESTNKVKITYIDTGNSNSTLIKMPGGTNVLINAGSSTDKYYSAERNVIPYLKTERINSIDLLILNSLNINEFKNVIYFVKHHNVKKIILPVYYESLFGEKNPFENVKAEFVNESKIINKQGNFRIYIYYNPDLKSESMMTEFVYGEQSFIFNDSYNPIDEFMNTAYLPDENALMVLKASGSGSFDYNSADFIAKADPEFVVISSSDRGRKKVEADIFAESLNESGYTVLKTSREGAIIFETDGYETNRVLWK